ncbi:MAG: ferredoxin-type protein NapG [Gammaproteobacteria bacterium]|nr:MAG: ferredoxin-type protein NapG [Gammaproteobacteria bacterium]
MSKAEEKPKSSERRRFLVDTMRTVGAVTVAGLGLGIYDRQVASALPAQAIRPPGALPEREFLGACIRCGLCVRDCPYGTLRLARPGEPVATGTPWFRAREVPCEMCEDIPCVKACPTGALDHGLTDIDQARMGLAVIVDQESCIAFQGLRCEVCFNICPLRGKAITIEMQHNRRSGTHARFIPVVHSEACTGCGKCEHACILDEAAIKVIPLDLARGMLGRHYRLGWKHRVKGLTEEEKSRRFNLPEGVEYDYRTGIVRRKANPAPDRKEGGVPPDDSPFGDDPLESLRRRRRALP